MLSLRLVLVVFLWKAVCTYTSACSMSNSKESSELWDTDTDESTIEPACTPESLYYMLLIKRIQDRRVVYLKALGYTGHKEFCYDCATCAKPVSEVLRMHFPEDDRDKNPLFKVINIVIRTVTHVLVRDEGYLPKNGKVGKKLVNDLDEAFKLLMMDNIRSSILRVFSEEFKTIPVPSVFVVLEACASLFQIPTQGIELKGVKEAHCVGRWRYLGYLLLVKMFSVAMPVQITDRGDINYESSFGPKEHEISHDLKAILKAFIEYLKGIDKTSNMS